MRVCENSQSHVRGVNLDWLGAEAGLLKRRRERGWEFREIKGGDEQMRGDERVGEGRQEEGMGEEKGRV